MTTQEFQTLLITSNLLEQSIKKLVFIAREFRNHGFEYDFGFLSKYRLTSTEEGYSKDDLIEKVEIAREKFLGHAVGRPDDEVEEAALPEGMVGFVPEASKELFHIGLLYTLISAPAEPDAHGHYTVGLLTPEGKKVNAIVLDDKFIKDARKNLYNFREPVLEVGLDNGLYFRKYKDIIYREFKNDYNRDFVIFVKQYGIPDPAPGQNEYPEYEVLPDGKKKIIMDPLIEVVKGVKVRPILSQSGDGTVGRIDQEWCWTEVNVNTPQYKYIKSGDIIPIVMDVDDVLEFNKDGKLVHSLAKVEKSDACKRMWHFFSRRAFKVTDDNGNLKDRRWIFGEPKEYKFFASTKKIWNKIFNQDLYEDGWFDKNPNKTWKATTGTPRECKAVGSTREQFRLRLVDEEYFKPESLKAELIAAGLEGDALEAAWARVLGYKKYDGVIHTNGIKFRVLTKRDFRPPRKRKALAKWKGPRWRWIRSVLQVRSAEGSPAALKGTINGDKDTYDHRCKRGGFHPDEQDGISTMDIIKTNKKKFKHGDIVVFNTSDIEVIKFRMSNWSSSIGTQCIRLDTPSARILYEEKGVPKRAELLKLAAEGRLDQLFELLSYGGKEDTWEDSRTLGLKLIFGSQYIPDWGDWRSILHSQNRGTINARLRSFMVENVLKNACWDRAYYLQTDGRLDEYEEMHHQHKLRKAYSDLTMGKDTTLSFEQWSVNAKGGKLIPFEYVARPPKSNEIKTLVEAGNHFNLGGNPLVGPGNLMGFTVLIDNPNPTYDSWYISHRAAKTMYRDVDGDMIIVVPSKLVKFPTYIAKPSMVETIKEEKPVITTDEEYFEQILIPIVDQAFNSAAAVGRLDNLTRRLVVERWWAWTEFNVKVEKGLFKKQFDRMTELERASFIKLHEPLTPEECLDMGQVVENHIAGLKHAGRFLSLEETEELLISNYGIYEPRAGERVLGYVSQAHNDYKIMRPDVGNKDCAGSPSFQMNEVARLLPHTTFHNLHPLDTTFEKMRGMEIVVHHEDSVRIQKAFQEEHRAVVERIGKNVYPWKLRDITVPGEKLGKGYSAESVQLMRKRLDRKARRAAFSDLYKKYKAMIEEILIQKFGSTTSNSALAFSRQLAIYVGMTQFGMSKTDQDRSLGGSCFWCFDPVEVVLFFAERWDQPVSVPGGRRPEGVPANPYIIKVRESVERQLVEDNEFAQEDGPDSYYTDGGDEA